MKLGSLLYHAALIACLGVVAAHSQVWNWSQTPASNGTIDPILNWQEGMPPAAVNDSARATLARIAQYRDDVAGKVVATGTSSAYSAISNSGSSNPPKDGQEFSFVPPATNVSGVTLQVDGGTNYPIQSPVTTAIGSAVLIQGTPYTVVFNLANSSWVLKGLMGNPYNVPLGAFLDYSGSSAPNSNFVLPFGQAISRTTYAAYFALVGTTYGAGDGSTTFGVPDLRGRVVAGLDNLGGSSAGRLSICGNDTTLGGACGQQSETITVGNLPNVNFTISSVSAGDSGTVTIGAGQGSHNHTASTAGPQGFAGGGSFGPTSGVAALSSTYNTTVNSNTLPSMTGTFSGTASCSSNCGTVPSGGSGTALGTVQPSFFVTKILRVL